MKVRQLKRRTVASIASTEVVTLRFWCKESLKGTLYKTLLNAENVLRAAVRRGDYDFTGGVRGPVLRDDDPVHPQDDAK